MYVLRAVAVDFGAEVLVAAFSGVVGVLVFLGVAFAPRFGVAFGVALAFAEAFGVAFGATSGVTLWQ